MFLAPPREESAHNLYSYLSFQPERLDPCHPTSAGKNVNGLPASALVIFQIWWILITPTVPVQVPGLVWGPQASDKTSCQGLYEHTKKSTPGFGPLLHLSSTRTRLNLLPETRPSATVDTVLALGDHALKLHSFDHAEEAFAAADKVFGVTDSTCISLG